MELVLPEVDMMPFFFLGLRAHDLLMVRILKLDSCIDDDLRYIRFKTSALKQYPDFLHLTWTE